MKSDAGMRQLLRSRRACTFGMSSPGKKQKYNTHLLYMYPGAFAFSSFQNSCWPLGRNRLDSSRYHVQNRKFRLP